MKTLAKTLFAGLLLAVLFASCEKTEILAMEEVLNDSVAVDSGIVVEEWIETDTITIIVEL